MKGQKVLYALQECGLCCIYPTLPLSFESQTINKWVWLCVNATLLTTTVGQLDLSLGLANQFAALLWAFKSKEMIMRKGSLYFREGVSGVVENLDLGARCYVSTPAGPLIACGILGK